MIKYKSELIGIPAIYEDTIIGFVKDLIIDNTDGKILAYSLDKNHKKIIPYDRLIFFMDRYISLELNPVFDIEDIIQINKLVEANLNLKNQIVKVQSTGRVVGKLTDYSITIGLGTLTQLVVQTSKFWFFGFENRRIINADHIYSIEPDCIWLTDEFEKIDVLEKEAEPAMGSA